MRLADASFRSMRGVAGGQGVVIGLEVVAKQRETEATLSLEGAVTCPAIAAEPAKQWDDVPLKARRFDAVGPSKLARWRQHVRCGERNREAENGQHCQNDPRHESSPEAATT
jgi:hypothetical protein